MNFHSPRNITLLFLLLLFGVSSFLYYPRRYAEKVMTAKLDAMLSADEMPTLEQRTKTAGCTRGVLPDRACTPGAVFTGATMDRVCVPGYSKTVRSVSQKMRKAVYAEYGIPYPQPRGTLEVDHLIPLALGGNNDMANLFAEFAEPVPGFREKDIVEIYLHDEVCAGRAALGAAQNKIASNWLLIYNNLTPEQIEQIKGRFKNWSQ